MVVDIHQLFSLILDFSLQIPVDDKFKNKSMIKKLFDFLTNYSLIDENYLQENLQRFNLSVSKMNYLTSETKANIIKTSSLGWFIKLTENRETEIRIKTWKLLTILLNKDILRNYPSCVDTALNVIYSPNEAFGVIMASEDFLSKVLELYTEIADIDYRDITKLDDMKGITNKPESITSNLADRTINENGKAETFAISNISDLMTRIYRRNIVSHLKNFFLIKECPSLFKGNAIVLLKNITMINPQKTLPIISQFEIWDLVIDIFSPKFDKNLATLQESNDHMYWDLLIQNNDILQFFIFAISYDKQIGDYLVNCTAIIKFIIKWLSIAQASYYQSEQHNAKTVILDNFNASLSRLLNTLLTLNEEKTLFMINKVYEDKLTKSRGKSQKSTGKITFKEDKRCEETEKMKRYNIYYLISSIFYQTKADNLLLNIYKLLSNILPKWNKGYSLIENQDQNGEVLSETLILSIYSQFKLNELLWIDKKVCFDNYWDNKCIMISCICALLYVSNKAKNSLICSGFLSYLASSMTNAADKSMIDDLNTHNNNPSPLTKKGKTGNLHGPSQDFELSISMLSGVSKTIQAKTSSNLEDLMGYMRILKYLFIEPALVNQTGNFDNELKSKFEDHSVKIFECLTRVWRICSRKEELYEEYLKCLSNFATNKAINSVCFGKMIESKIPIFNDILTQILKYDFSNFI